MVRLVLNAAVSIQKQKDFCVESQPFVGHGYVTVPEQIPFFYLFYYRYLFILVMSIFMYRYNR